MVKFKEYDTDTLKHLQKVELMILKDVVEVLDKHNFPYYAFFGTLLGAVRHQGFIPWDDDIDIVMFRKDYEKAIPILKKELSNKYNVFSPDNNEDYYYSFAKVFLKGTKFLEHYLSNSKFEFGIFIDIFPLDNVPNNKLKFKFQKFSFVLLYNLMISSVIKLRFDSKFRRILQNTIHSFLKILPISTKTWKKWYKSILTYYNDEDTKYVTYAPSSEGYPLLERKDFNYVIKCSFEDFKINIPKNYEKILTKIYGNYMQLPPKEKRINHAPEILDFGKY